MHAKYGMKNNMGADLFNYKYQVGEVPLFGTVRIPSISSNNLNFLALTLLNADGCRWQWCTNKSASYPLQRLTDVPFDNIQGVVLLQARPLPPLCAHQVSQAESASINVAGLPDEQL